MNRLQKTECKHKLYNNRLVLELQMKQSAFIIITD